MNKKMSLEELKPEIMQLLHENLPGAPTANAFKATLEKTREKITFWFSQKYPIETLLELYTFVVDDLITTIWQQQTQSKDHFCLIATGGYGRKELFPFSDIDITLICENAASHLMENFISYAWSCGLKIHNTVRTLSESLTQAETDHATYSSLLESRYLLGEKTLYDKLDVALFDNKRFPLKKFIHDKKNEQQQRHNHYNDTNYNLEPDIKNGPGGLRDLHILQWLILRRFSSFSMQSLCTANFINSDELSILTNARSFLMSIRFVLHNLANRAEDRLLFDFQPKLADLFEMPGSSSNEKVEALMQQFFTISHTVTLFSEIILSLFVQESAHKNIHPERVLSDDFFVFNKILFHAQEKVFTNNAQALFQLFAFYAGNPDITHIAPQTIRALLHAKLLINEHFRHDPINNHLFLQILQSNRVYQTLWLMSHYNILGAFLPPFLAITRKMQYDLFHAYTVDAHILFVIRNLENFVSGINEKLFPLCSQTMRKIAKPELLYLAALFHDIGKGNKESHSLVGARLVADFSHALQLAKEEEELIAWLVQNHLLFSKMAQHKDLNDPEVITEFALQIGTVSRLNHLYLLTVADIHATNEKLWNTWRASLLQELYIKTHRFLTETVETTINIDEKKNEIREKIIALPESVPSRSSGIPAFAGTGSFSCSRENESSAHRNFVCDEFVEDMSDDYFLRYTSEEIASHYQLIHAEKNTFPIIRIKQHRLEGATEIFIYTLFDEKLFCRIACTLGNLRFTIVEATIHLSLSGYCLSTYVVLEHNYEPIVRKDRFARLQQRLEDQLRHPNASLPASTGWHKRQPVVRFNTQVHFEDFESKDYTMMSLLTRDRPGLLAQVGKLFIQYKISLRKAKISTLGDRVEDLFYVTAANTNGLLTAEQKKLLQEALCKLLDVGEAQ